MFGCERFNQYLVRREKIHVETDHQPLESIFRKSLLAAPCRLQRMLLLLQKIQSCSQLQTWESDISSRSLSRAAQYENTVKKKVAKSLLKKAVKDNKDPWLALLDQRNTPTESLGSSPVQRLMSRRTRTLLSTATNLLYPKVPENVDQLLKLKRQKTKFYHDR